MSDNIITNGGRCRYCGMSTKYVKVGREAVGSFNKPGEKAIVCNICDKFSTQSTTPERPDGPETELQES
jgi:hypothetical protein